MKIGDFLCDRFADEKTEDDTYIYPYDGGVFNCQVSADIPAGIYNAKLKNQYGWSDKKLSLPGIDPYTNNLYDAKIHPLIKEIS